MKELISDSYVDKLLDQLETLDRQFKFYTIESEKIDNLSAEIDYKNIPEEEKIKQQIDLNRKIMELFSRYSKDSEYFDKLIKEINDYYLKKYNINFNLRELIYGVEENKKR